ncbi:MAG: hypothetical protein EZS28_017595 [Streblomastix strix]|uniref:Uncharacterized protein n=1 Tax=Streblomastix strix TaxID=222440 RepID=A0A5J4VX67_9EUKA|nr:MAG: hypothetical protein EZS28_017595 [Streblomastix strix]
MQISTAVMIRAYLSAVRISLYIAFTLITIMIRTEFHTPFVRTTNPYKIMVKILSFSLEPLIDSLAVALTASEYPQMRSTILTSSSSLSNIGLDNKQRNEEDVQIGGVSQNNIRLLLSMMSYGKAVNMLVSLSPKDKFATKVELEEKSTKSRKMAFIKLVLLLAALSFAARIRGKLYFDPGEVDKNGVVTIDVGKYKNDSELALVQNISDYKTLSKEDVDSFNLVADDKSAFDKLKTSGGPGNFGQCIGVYYTYLIDLYGLMGYTAKAVAGADINPSVTWFFKNAPTNINYVNTDDITDEEEMKSYQNLTMTQTCVGEANVWSSYAIARGGVADAGCYANDQVPVDNICNVDGGSSETYLKGYRVGVFSDADTATLKQIIARFGAARVTGLGIVIGWEQRDDNEYWIHANQKNYALQGYGYDWDTSLITEEPLAGAVIGSQELEPDPDDDDDDDDDVRPDQPGDDDDVDDDDVVDVDSSSTIRVALGFVSVVVFIPVLMLFF